MSRTVLTFKLEHTKDAAVASICRKLDIRKIEVPVEDYGQKLGCLAGISGFPKEKIPYGKAPFPKEMLVFSGMDSEHLDDFLSEYKKTAMRTPKMYSTSFTSFLLSDWSDNTIIILYMDLNVNKIENNSKTKIKWLLRHL